MELCGANNCLGLWIISQTLTAALRQLEIESKPDKLVHQFNLDVLAATGHQALSWDPNAIPYGELMLGLDPSQLPGQNRC